MGLFGIIMFYRAFHWKEGAGRQHMWRQALCVPSLPGEESSFDFPGRTPVTDDTFGNAVLLGKLADGNKVHTLSAILM